jgi:hypothetical protein
MITAIGKIEKKDIGMGVWALVTNDGTTYELLDCPRELRKDGIAVKIEGAIDEEAMTAAAIGQVLRVGSFEISN